MAKECLRPSDEPRYLDIAKLLLEARSDINQTLDDDETALTRAAMYGHVPMVKLLLDAQAAPDAVTAKDWRTALGIASHLKDGAVVCTLLDGGATPTKDAAMTAAMYTLAENNCAHEIPEWTAERLEVVQARLVDLMACVGEGTSVFHAGLGFRVLGLLVLRTGAVPCEKLCDAVGNNEASLSYPVHQARLVDAPLLHEAQLVAAAATHEIDRYPSGHPLRGVRDDDDARLIEILVQRAGTGQRSAPVADLGLGGDGHGHVRGLEELLRVICHVTNPVPSMA